MKLISLIILSLTFLAASVNAQGLVEPRKPYSYLDSRPGFVTINELTAGFSPGEVSLPYSKSYFGFTTINGYQSDINFMVGAGLGISYYEDATVVPVFIHIRYNFSIHPVTPFIFSDVGLFITSNSGANMFINPGIGIMYSLNHKVGLNIGMGYSFLASQVSDSFISLRLGATYKPVKRLKRMRH